MSIPTSQLTNCVDNVVAFSGNHLTVKINKLEFMFAGLTKADVQRRLAEHAIDQELFAAARTIKKAAAQIDVVLHAIGILVLLPNILRENERVVTLSLGAGSAEGKRFDMETDQRVAEFTFIDWQGNDNTRLEKIFKDFYRLADFPTHRTKELWLTSATYVLKYFRSRTSVRSATNKHRDVWEDFQRKYPSIEHVADYYRLQETAVSFRTYEEL